MDDINFSKESSFQKKDGDFNNYQTLLKIVYQDVERKVRKSKHYKLSHFEKPGREKAINFVMGINITPPSSSCSKIALNCYFPPS